MVTRSIELQDGMLHLVEEGHGTPLLLVHGFPLDHTMWRHQIATFARTHRVLAPDLRGFGRSAVTADTVTMEQFADDLAQLLVRAEVAEPVIFCGLSMGGYIAWQFWQRHADRLRALILCDTRASADPPEVARGRQMMAEQVLRQGTSLVADSMETKLFAPWTTEHQPELLSEIRRVIENTAPQGIAAAQRGMAQRPDVTDQLPKISLPTLVVCGQDDTITSAAEMQQLAATMPNAQFCAIANAGHMAPLEQPDAVNSHLARFLDQVG